MFYFLYLISFLSIFTKPYHILRIFIIFLCQTIYFALTKIFTPQYLKFSAFSPTSPNLSSTKLSTITKNPIEISLCKFSPKNHKTNNPIQDNPKSIFKHTKQPSVATAHAKLSTAVSTILHTKKEEKPQDTPTSLNLAL